MRESQIESTFRRLVKAAGGKSCKFTVPGERGHPDRLAILPGGSAFLVELKAEDGVVKAQQVLRVSEWRAVGMRVYVAHSVAEAREVLRVEQALIDRSAR